MLTDEQLEKLIKKALEEEFEKIDVPDPEPSWRKIEVRLRKEHRKKKRFSYLKRTGWIAAAMLLAVMIASEPQTTSAFNRLFQIFHDWKEGIVRIVFNTSDHQGKALTPPPPSDEPLTEGDVVATTVNMEVSLDEAKDNLSFSPVIPNFSNSKGYRLDKVEIWPYDNGRKSDKLSLVYVKEGGWFSILEQKIYPDMAGGEYVNQEEIKRVQVGNAEGFLISYKSGNHGLEWMSGEIHFSIFGKITEEEAFEIADALQK